MNTTTETVPRLVLEKLEAGKVVAAATESFFGLLADATSVAAVDTLLSLKPRGSDKGIPIILPDSATWPLLVEAIPEAARGLGQSFWPGALSIGLAIRHDVDPRLALDGTVAVRVPGQSAAASIARAFGKPLTATSANLPGMPPATRNSEVTESFARACELGELYVLEGNAPGGKPSTIVVFDEGGVRVAREGAIPARLILNALAGA